MPPCHKGRQLHFGLFQISRVHVVAVTRQCSRISSGPSARIGTSRPGKLPGEPSSQREAKPVSHSSPALPSKTGMIWVEAQLSETVPAGLPCLAVPTTLSLHSAARLGGKAPLPSAERRRDESRPHAQQAVQQAVLRRPWEQRPLSLLLLPVGVCVCGGGGATVFLSSFQEGAQPSWGVPAKATPLT